MEVLLVPADPNDPSGVDVVHKTATLPGERERLLREAEVLRTAADRGVPGVVRVVTPPSTEADEPVLVTTAAAGRSLAAADPLPLVEVAGVAAEVARLLAGLHKAGLVHGAVEPGHVVLDGNGGALLVGFGRGGEIGSPAAEPGGVEGGRLDPASDVAGWGALLGHLLDWSAVGEEEPMRALQLDLRTRAARRKLRRSPDQTSRTFDTERRALASLSDQAQNPDPAHRPLARAVAAHAEHCCPGARMPGAAASSLPPPGPAPSLLERLSGHAAGACVATHAELPRDSPSQVEVEERSSPPGPSVLVPTPRRKAALVVTGACIIVVGLGALGAMSRPSTSASSRPAAVAKPPRKACPPAVRPAADADGDGCEETVSWADGVLRAGTARFALGAPGDAWAVGDWDCDGRRTPALLHDGSVVVFDSWPAPGHELQGRPMAMSSGARQLTLGVGPDGCERPAPARVDAAGLLVDPRMQP